MRQELENLKGHGLLFYETRWSWNKMVQPPVPDKNCTVEKLIKWAKSALIYGNLYTFY